MDRSQREGIEPEEIWAQESVEEGRTSNKRRSTLVERLAPTHCSETSDNFVAKDKLDASETENSNRTAAQERFLSRIGIHCLNAVVVIWLHSNCYPIV
jgi:hypothetical protein